MIPKVKCPNCGETEDIRYSVIQVVNFYHIHDLEITIDVDELQKDIEENTSINDVVCRCLTCNTMFPGGDYNALDSNC